MNKPKNTSEQEKTALHYKRNVGRLPIRIRDLIHVGSHAVKGRTRLSLENTLKYRQTNFHI
jgi:hypothetical protein